MLRQTHRTSRDPCVVLKINRRVNMSLNHLELFCCWCWKLFGFILVPDKWKRVKIKQNCDYKSKQWVRKRIIIFADALKGYFTQFSLQSDLPLGCDNMHIWKCRLMNMVTCGNQKPLRHHFEFAGSRARHLLPRYNSLCSPADGSDAAENSEQRLKFQLVCGCINGGNYRLRERPCPVCSAGRRVSLWAPGFLWCSYRCESLHARGY